MLGLVADATALAFSFGLEALFLELVLELTGVGSTSMDEVEEDQSPSSAMD